MLGFSGVGPAAVRALAYVAETLYGSHLSWKDPVKFTFALGGKDGIPYPVDRSAMDKTIDLLESAVAEVRIGRGEKLEALRRLRRLAPP